MTVTMMKAPFLMRTHLNAVPHTYDRGNSRKGRYEISAEEKCVLEALTSPQR